MKLGDRIRVITPDALDEPEHWIGEIIKVDVDDADEPALHRVKFTNGNVTYFFEDEMELLP